MLSLLMDEVLLRLVTVGFALMLQLRCSRLLCFEASTGYVSNWSFKVCLSFAFLMYLSIVEVELVLILLPCFETFLIF